MKLILARHGQTVENLGGLIQGQRPGNLSEKGKEQAKNLAERLRHQKLKLIISSDLARARDTASIVARERQVDLVFDRRLRERSYGRYEGKPTAELVSAMKTKSLDYATFHPERGESYFDFTTRVFHSLRTICDRHSEDETVCLVTHNGVIKILLNFFADLKISGNGHDAVANCEFVTININRDGEATLESIHELTKRLENNSPTLA